MTDSPVFLNDGDDPEMASAIRRARQTFRYFYREVAWEQRRIVPGLDLACVKVAFSDPGPASADQPAVEQMWISDIDFDGKLVSGTLINSPNWLTSVAEGDQVQVPPSRVSDWMYAIEGKVYGAYTVNVMRSQMSRNERAGHDGAWGLDFGDPKKIQIVPPDYLGKPNKGGLLGRLGRGGEVDQDPALLAGKEHPMAVNMVQKFEEFLQQDPTNITSVDDEGFTVLHQMSLAGAAGCVSILIAAGADVNAVTNNGMAPLSLAKSLGWKKVYQILSQHGAK